MSYQKDKGHLDCKVYVGELGHGCCKEELEDRFSKFGALRNVWVARRPAGFAFVEFDDARDAKDAVRRLDGTSINGRRARVEMSSGRSRRGGNGVGGGGDGGSYRHGNSRGPPRYDDYRMPRRSPSPYREKSRSFSPIFKKRKSRSFSRSTSRD